MITVPATAAELISSDPAKQQQRKKEVRARSEQRYASQAQRFRTKLADFYGPQKADAVKFAQAFELCEYG